MRVCHAPKCQRAASAAWLEQRAAELLPVGYFHVVFTLPQMVAPLALQNQVLGDRPNATRPASSIITRRVVT
jgi:transposase-like zinc-binding protein